MKEGGPKMIISCIYLTFFTSRRRYTRFDCDWSSDVCSSDLVSDHQLVEVVLVSSQTVGVDGEVHADVLLLDRVEVSHLDVGGSSHVVSHESIQLQRLVLQHVRVFVVERSNGLDGCLVVLQSEVREGWTV